DAADARERQLQSALAEERRRREESELQVGALSEALDGWRATCQRLEQEVLDVNARLADARAELRRVRLAARNGLRDCDVRKRDSNVRQRRPTRRSGG
ncbi:unnamed protein product, partial [Agarophyton chilense]